MLRRRRGSCGGSIIIISLFNELLRLRRIHTPPPPQRSGGEGSSMMSQATQRWILFFGLVCCVIPLVLLSHHFIFLTLVSYLYFIHHEERMVEWNSCARRNVCRGAMMLVHRWVRYLYLISILHCVKINCLIWTALILSWLHTDDPMDLLLTCKLIWFHLLSLSWILTHHPTPFFSTSLILILYLHIYQHPWHRRKADGELAGFCPLLSSSIYFNKPFRDVYFLSVGGQFWIKPISEFIG